MTLRRERNAYIVMSITTMHLIATINIIDIDSGDFVDTPRSLVHLRRPYEVIAEYFITT